jgi:hypothetical protein
VSGRWIGVVAAIPILLGVASCGQKSSNTTNVIAALPATAATVNGKPIATSAVIQEAFDEAGPTALGALIDYQILDQAAISQHIVVTQADIDARRQQMIGQVGSIAFNKEIETHHVTQAQVDDKLRHEIILERLSEKQLPPPVLMAHLRTILIATAPTHRGVDIHQPHSPAEALKIITEVQAQLRAGKSFDSVARAYSEDPYSRPNGGDLGVISKDDDPFSATPNAVGGPLWDSVQGLKAGQVTPKPVKSYLGYHLVQVVSWSTSPLPSDAQQYAAVTKQMHDFLLQRLMQGTMAKLRDQAQINETLFGKQ